MPAWFSVRPAPVARRCLALLVLLLAPIAGATPDTEPAPNEQFDDAVLQYWNRDLFTFRATIGGETPAERRAAAVETIRSVPDMIAFQPVTRQNVSIGSTDGIAFRIGGKRLFVIVAGDLEPTAEQSLDEAGDELLLRLEELREAWLEQRSVGVVLRGVGLSVGALLFLLLVIFALHRLGGLVRRQFVRWLAHLEKLKRQDVNLLPLLVQLARRLVALAIFGLGLAAAYLCLGFILRQFPYTAPWGDVLGDQVVLLLGRLVNGLAAAIPGMLVVLLIFFLTRGAARMVDQLVAGLNRTRDGRELLAQDTTRATRRIACIFIWLAGVMIAYPYIPGSDSPAFKGIGVLLGLMVSIGSSGFINQLMSGFVVLYSNSVHTGEYVRVGEFEGTVSEVGFLATKLVTPKSEFVSVPNALFLSREAVNFSRQLKQGRAEFSTRVGIGYDVPAAQVREMLLHAASRTPGVRRDPAPSVLQLQLADFNVEYELRFVAESPETRGKVLSDLHDAILEEFNSKGVQIMSPHFVNQPRDKVVPPPGGQDS